MLIKPPRLSMILVGLVMILLEIIAAPALVVGLAYPNFIIAFIIAITVTDPQHPPIGASFVLGLLFVLTVGSTIGAMAFSLSLISYAIAALLRMMQNVDAISTILVIIIGCILVQTVYAFFMMVVLSGVNFGDALAYVIMPCGFYDAIISLVFFLTVGRLFKHKTTPMPSSMDYM